MKYLDIGKPEYQDSTICNTDMNKSVVAIPWPPDKFHISQATVH